MTVSSLRATFAAALRKNKPQTAAATSQMAEDETEYTLWRIVQQEGSSAAGLAIWMCWKLTMQPGEIAALTWEQVDMERGCIHLSDRDIDMGTRMQRLLGEVWDRQKSLNEPQVFVAPTTGRPMDQARLSVLCRTAMIRGGLEDFSLRILAAWTHARQIDSAILQRAEKLGFLVREDVIQLLNNRLVLFGSHGEQRKAGEDRRPLLSAGQCGSARKPAGYHPRLPFRARCRQSAGLHGTPSYRTPSGNAYSSGNGETRGACPGRKALPAACGE